MQGVNQHIRSSLRFSTFAKHTSTSRPGNCQLLFGVTPVAILFLSCQKLPNLDN